MGDADLMDSLVVFYGHSQRNKLWMHGVLFFEHLITAVLNAWRLYKNKGRVANDVLELEISISTSLIYKRKLLIEAEKTDKSSTCRSNVLQKKISLVE